MKRRFPCDEDEIIAKFSVLDPTFITNKNAAASIAQFGTLVQEKKLMISLTNTDASELLRNCTVLMTKWKFQSSGTNCVTLKKAWNNEISKFITILNYLTALPHSYSSVCVEQIFSQVNSVKTSIVMST